MTSVNLTAGSIEMISQGLGDKMQPVLQVLEVRQVNTQQSSLERYRIVLSDGTYSQQGMLATQMNWIVKSGPLQKGSIVMLTEFMCNNIQNRRIIIVISLEILVEKADFIGAPKRYDSIYPLTENHPGQVHGQNQPGLSLDNVQPHGNSRSNGPDAGQHALDVSSFPRQASTVNNQPYGSSFAGGSLPVRNTINANSLPTKADSPSGMGSNQIGNLQQQRFPGSSIGGFQPPGNSCGHPAPPTYQQPSAMYTNRGPIAKNDAPARIIPIAALNPYQGKWTIKARVTSKGDMKLYNNAKGDGKVFSFDLLDSDGGEIRVTCFNNVADQFYDQIEKGGVYLISKGTLKPAQKTFNHLNNEYEITLDSTSTIQPCLDADSSIPKQQFSFRAISEIESLENNSMVDLIGIVTSISPAGTIMRKNGTETHKRTLQLKDMSGKSVEVTLWGNFCNTEGQQMQLMCDSGTFPVLAIKAARVSDFNGKSVGTIISSQLAIDPDIPEAHRIREWFDREGKNHIAFSISKETTMVGKSDVRKMVSQIKDEGLGRSEKPDWITVKATISFMKVDNFCYTACPLMVAERQCSKKANNNGDGTWHCDRCDQSFPECDYRYILQFQIQDHTGLTWVTAFQECGEEILGISAKELYFLKYEEQDELKFAEVVRKVLFNQYLFKLKVKEETFSDEQRVKSTAIKAERVNPSAESKFLLSMIERLSREEANVVPSMNNPGSLQSEFTPNGSSGGLDRYRITPSNQVSQFDGYASRGTLSVEPPFCNSCGSSGHSSHNCPRSGFANHGSGFTNRSSAPGMDSGNSSNVCFKCNQPGHWARDCPRVISEFGRSISSSAGGPHASNSYGKQYVGSF